MRKELEVKLAAERMEELRMKKEYVEEKRGDNLLLRAVVARCAFVRDVCAVCAVCAVYAVYAACGVCCCVRYCILIHRCDPLSSSLLGTTSVLRRRGRKSQMGMEACTTTMRYVNPSCVKHPLYTHPFIYLLYLHSYTCTLVIRTCIYTIYIHLIRL